MSNNPNTPPGSSSFNQPSPGTSPKVITKLANKGVPRGVTTVNKNLVATPSSRVPGSGIVAANIQGGRSNVARLAAAKAAAARNQKSGKNGANVGTPPAPVAPIASTPSAADLTPEDQALSSIAAPTNPGYGAVGQGGTDLAGQFNPAAYASSMAGMQYDPQIAQMATRIKGIINALPGSLQSLHTAFGNLDARQAAVPTQTPLGSNLGASGAAYAAATANNNTAATQAQANSADAREADWATRIKLLSGANVDDLRGQLGGLTKGKADAQVGYMQQGIKTKSDLVSQAIANINSIRASNDAQAMVEGNLKQQGANVTKTQLQNTGIMESNLYAPYQEAASLAAGSQGLAAGTISLQQAAANLKSNAPKDNLASALKSNPQAAASLNAMIIPQGGVVQTTDAAGNVSTKVPGNPNAWSTNAVSQIMKTLPKSNRANVHQYVTQQIAAVISGAGWKQNSKGKWIRPK